MQATLIEKYSTHTALYQLDPPMKFVKPHASSPNSDVIVESDKVVVHSAAITDDYNRVVIHFAESLAGEGGVCYGAQGSRTLDGVSQHSEALALSGYTLAN